MWDKTDVENLIYARAASERKTLLTTYGCLLCRNAEPRLAALLGIYNRFFAAENRRFLRQEMTLSSSAALADYQYFLQEKELKPLLSAPYLTLKNPPQSRGSEKQ